MRLYTDPLSMSPEQRFKEIAEILAKGMLRLLGSRQSREDSPSEKPPEKLSDPLDLSAKTRLSVTDG